MRCVLFNKDTKILEAEYDGSIGTFIEIYEIYNIDYAPYILMCSYKQNKDINKFKVDLNKWFNKRGIPSWRDRLDILLHRLNIDAPYELLDKAFALSLSDQYWLKPKDLNVKYNDINFFDNDFNYSEFLEASLSKENKTIKNNASLKTPNNTTDGMLKKAWIIENGVRYLIKGGYRNETLQPFNEVLASEICDRLGFDYVPYTIDIYKGTIVSKCPCFIDKNSEFISCYQILSGIEENDYESYIKKLEEEGIKDARLKIENMYILDFLMLNNDRHLNNFGIIRDVNTLKWKDVAPIFDNGQSLDIEYYDDKEMHIVNEGRLFYEILPFEEIIKVVKDINRIDISRLDGIVEWFDDLLHKYQNITNYSDSRINKLCILLNRQINKLSKTGQNY